MSLTPAAVRAARVVHPIPGQLDMFADTDENPAQDNGDRDFEGSATMGGPSTSTTERTDR